MKRYNIHYVQRNPDEYFQPYAVQHKEGQWIAWKDVEKLQKKLNMALNALQEIGSGTFARGINMVLEEIEEVGK